MFDVAFPDNASFIYKSLYASRHVVAKGAMKHIGNDSSIQIWEDPWLPDASIFFMDSPNGNVKGPVFACDLFLPGIRRWDEEKVRSLFTVRDAELILLLPSSNSSNADF